MPAESITLQAQIIGHARPLLGCSALWPERSEALSSCICMCCIGVRVLPLCAMRRGTGPAVLCQCGSCGQGAIKRMQVDILTRSWLLALRGLYDRCWGPLRDSARAITCAGSPSVRLPRQASHLQAVRKRGRFAFRHFPKSDLLKSDARVVLHKFANVGRSVVYRTHSATT